MNFFLKYVFIVICIVPKYIDARIIRVAIGSKSIQKIEAVQKAFEQKFQDDICLFFSHATISGVPEQPIGFDIALQGARNRIDSLPKDLQELDYCIGIENYIEQSKITGSWYDKALVLVQELSQETMLTTQPVFIPDQYIQLAQSMSKKFDSTGFSTTVGVAIARSFVDRFIDPANWHIEKEFGGVSRQELLEDALCKILHAQELQSLKKLVAFYPDFPKKGITFANFLPIVQDGNSFSTLIDLLAERYADKNIDAIAGLESRGFILAAALATKLGLPFIAIRKPGKLPGAVHAVTYQKEYGFDTLVIAQDSIKKDQRVLIIDDLIATGGSARAAIKLVELAGGKPIEFVSILKIAELEEQAVLPIPMFNLID
ncbi:MAG: adenine phosphoribosyltransferase [Candidatus Chromulinivorax sp.]